MTTRWTSPDGRVVVVEEDLPGVVHVTTEALGGLLRLAGFTEEAEPIRGVAVQGTREVRRGEDGRCLECGAPATAEHHNDCPHHSTDTQHARTFGAPYEKRPDPFPVERR